MVEYVARHLKSGAVIGEARVELFPVKIHDTDRDAKMPLVKLTYFDLEGRGELIRLLLHAGNIDFEDFRFGFGEWAKHKPNTPFGSVPVLHWDGEEMAQTMAIVRFVARKVGMAGKTDMEFFKADMVACHFEDIFTKLPGLRFAKTQEDRVTKAKEMMEDFLPKWLAPLETLLKKRGGEWYSGSGPTFADLAMMVALDFMHAPEEMAFKDMDNLKERRALLDKFPLVKGNYQCTCQLPSVWSWKAKKPAFHGF